MAKSDERRFIDTKPMKDFIAAQSRKGVPCPECGTVAEVDGGNGGAVVPFPNGMGGIVFYLICTPCAHRYERHGRAGLPNVWADSCTTPLMNQYAPSGQASQWVH